jgi:hypothetical protein
VTVQILPIPDAVEVPVALIRSAAFKAWFQNSIVLDSKGRPMLMFHGTARLIRQFDRSRHVDLEGAYFTPDFDVAKDYAEMDGSIDGDQPYVISAFIRLSNPYRMYEGESHVITTQLRDELVAAGYDGVIGASSPDCEPWEFVVFEPSQIAEFRDGKILLPEMEIPAVRPARCIEEDMSPSL